MLQRTVALLLASLLAASCATLPIGSVSPTSTLSLSLSGLFPSERQVQHLQAGKQAKVTVTGPGLAQPLTMTAPLDGSSAMATLTGIPAGPNRVIEVEAQDEAGEAIPGGRYRTTATLQEGANTAIISAATTPRGDVLARLLADGSGLAGTLDATLLQAKIEGIQRTQRVPHFALIDGGAIADALAANGGNLDALSESQASFVQQPTSLTVSVRGLPSNLKAEVWVDDPVSPKQTGVFNGNLRIEPVKPGSWRVYGRAGSLRIGPIAVTPGPGAGATLDFSRSVETLATLPQARAGAASGVLTLTLDGQEKDCLVLAGGITGAEAGSVVAFDGTTWYTLDGTMPLPVSHGAYAVHDNALWVLGGLTSDGKPSKAVQVFDGALWTTATELPVPSVLGSAAVVGDRLVFAAGYQAIGVYQNQPIFNLQPEIYVQNLAAPGDWVTANSLSTARMGASTVAMDGKVYFVSGLGAATPGTKQLLGVETFDPVSESVRAVAPIPTPRYGAMAWASEGKIYVAGGIDPLGKALDHVEAYDPTQDRWSVLPPLTTPRAHAAVATLNGKTVIAGGHDGLVYFGNIVPLDVVEALNP